MQHKKIHIMFLMMCKRKYYGHEYKYGEKIIYVESQIAATHLIGTRIMQIQ